MLGLALPRALSNTRLRIRITAVLFVVLFPVLPASLHGETPPPAALAGQVLSVQPSKDRTETMKMSVIECVVLALKNNLDLQERFSRPGDPALHLESG